MDQFNFSADVLVNRLVTMADGKTEVAMLDEFNRLTLDVVAKVHIEKKNCQNIIFIFYFYTYCDLLFQP